MHGIVLFSCSELKSPDIIVGIIKPDCPSQPEITDTIYRKTNRMCSARSFERDKVFPAVCIDGVFHHRLGTKKRNGVSVIITETHVGSVVDGKSGGSTGVDMVDSSTLCHPAFFGYPTICFWIEHMQII